MSQKLKAASISILINILLFISKIAISFFTGSIGLFAESIHSLFDLFASIAAYLGIKKAEEPDDENHHYGHEKYENLSSLFQSILIIGTSILIFWQVYQRLKEPTPVKNSEIGMVFIFITMIITFFVSRYLSNVSKKEGGSHALEADSAHFFTDVLSSISVFIGLLLVRLGFPFGDPLAAFGVGLVMLYISIDLLKRSFYVFMDFSPDDESVSTIKRFLEEEIRKKRITRYHKLRARMAGSSILLEFHIHVPRRLSVSKAHGISSEIKKGLKKEVPKIKDATIHIEPDS